MQKVLIIGATSAIAEATAKRFAKQGDKLFLLARNQERLESLAKDLEIRGAESVSFNTFVANRFSGHESLLESAIEVLGGLDVVLIAHGTLPDQKACESRFGTTLEELNTNAVSVISFLTPIANYLEQQGSGSIAVISSVAGDRGRQSNYVYGAAKSMVTTFLAGLRNRLSESGVQVLTIKPGFVDTPMTTDFKKGLLWVKPETVAHDIIKAIENKKDVLYTPFFWRLIMLIICNIPERIFKKMKL